MLPDDGPWEQEVRLAAVRDGVLSPPQVSDAELGPHPAEVVAGHRVVGVPPAAALAFQDLEPARDLLATSLGPCARARRLAAQHVQGLARAAR